MSTLGQKPATQHVSTQKQSITGNGGTSYTLQQSVSQASDIEVFVNNTRQEPAVAYTASGTTLTMTGAVNSSDSFYVIFQGKAIQTAGLPVDAAITASTVTTSQTITSTGNITTSGTVNTPSINGGQIGGRRNMIINGAMQVAQRGTSLAMAHDNGNTANFLLDRFQFLFGGSPSSLDGTYAQVADHPLSPNGKSLKWTTGTTETIAADEQLFVLQKVEAQDLQHLNFGNSNAQSTTLSFYVKSSITGTFSISLRKDDGTKRIANKTYTIDSANTWEKKTFTFVGDTDADAGIANDTGEGIRVMWHLMAGSNYTGGGNFSGWKDYVAADFAAGLATNAIATTNGATWQLADVQWEVGSQATPFEHRSYGEELNLCRRYFTVLADGRRSVAEAICQGSYYTANILFHTVVLPVEMRAQPSMITANGTNYYITFANGSGDHHDAIARSGNSSKSVVEIFAETNVSATAGHACFTRIGGTSADAKCMLEAEL